MAGQMTLRLAPAEVSDGRPDDDSPAVCAAGRVVGGVFLFRFSVILVIKPRSHFRLFDDRQ